MEKKALDSLKERYDKWFMERFGKDYVGTFPQGDLYDLLVSEVSIAKKNDIKGLDDDTLVRVTRAYIGTEQKELAKILGCYSSTISRWEHGQRKLNPKRRKWFELELSKLKDNK